MTRVPIPAAIALLCVSCGSEGRGLQRTPVDPAPPTASATHSQIAVGQPVHATLVGHGAMHRFELIAPSTGTLVMRVTWDSPGAVELWVGEQPVGQTSSPPMVARVDVRVGERYQLLVADAAAWDYDAFVLPYRLTTEIER